MEELMLEAISAEYIAARRAFDEENDIYADDSYFVAGRELRDICRMIDSLGLPYPVVVERRPPVSYPHDDDVPF